MFLVDCHGQHWWSVVDTTHPSHSCEVNSITYKRANQRNWHWVRKIVSLELDFSHFKHAFMFAAVHLKPSIY
jgi:hypothetical protein